MNYSWIYTYAYIYIVLFCITCTSCLLCVLYVSILLWFLGFPPLIETARKAMEHVYGNAVASAGGFSALPRSIGEGTEMYRGPDSQWMTDARGWGQEGNSIGFPVSLVACEARTMYITSGMHSDDVVRDCQLMWNCEIKWLQLGQIKEELYSIIVNSLRPIQNHPKSCV